MDESFLRSELEADIAVRLQNLSRIKTMPTRYLFRQDDIDSWLRCAFPIIYAEWEGFFVYALSLYFREVNKLHLKLDELSDKYFVRNADKNFKQLKEYPSDYGKRLHFLKNLLAYFRNMGEVDLNTEVNTESNLGFKVMNVILNGLNLTLIEDHIDHDAYSLKEDMDKFLLDKRNGLVHGDPASTVTTEQVTKAITLVDRLMNLTKETILNGYKNEVFKA